MSGLNPTTASRVGLVLAQVVEVHALTSDGLSYGSGYQLSQNLILTARHVVDGADHVRVRFGARQDPTLLVDATVVWRGVAMDMALLELRWPDGLEASAAPVVPPTLGALPDAIVRRIPFVTVGFPAHKQRPRPGGGSLRDTDQVDGDIPTAANLKTGRLDLQREGRLLTLGRQWMGISGAAVFARGLLVGVVIQAEAEGPLVAERLSVPVGTGASAFPERQEPPESVAVFRRLVEADGLPARLVPVRREPAYAKTIADIAARRPRIEGRAAELSELAQFARSATAYQWWQAGPWAGKTTLAAHFVTHPPGEVDVVAFFISRTRGQQSDAYLRETCDQLAALLDEDPPETAGLSAFNDLWVRSIEQARLPGRHLVLVVDGLDENDTVPPVAALLPVVLDPAVHVLLFSRRHPGIPEEVDADHPLWDPARWPRRELAPSPHAEHLERRAHQDLERHLADRTARQFLGLVAAAGPFPPEESIAPLHLQGFDVDLLAIEEVLDRAGRVLERQDGEVERYGFAHDTLREVTAKRVGTTAIAQHRSAVYRWADDHAAAGWPADTPAYLVHGYRDLLAGVKDIGRLAALPTPPRIRFLRARTGSDAAALRELGLALTGLEGGDRHDVVMACRLAIRRDQLIAPYSLYSYELAVGWASCGDWARAEDIQQHLHSSERVNALAELIETAVRAGEHSRAAALLDIAGGVVAQLAVEIRAELFGRLAVAAVGIGEQTQAVALLDAAEVTAEQVLNPMNRAEELGKISKAAARAGLPTRAEELLNAAVVAADELEPGWREAQLTGLVWVAVEADLWDRARLLIAQRDPEAQANLLTNVAPTVTSRAGVEALLDIVEAGHNADPSWGVGILTTLAPVAVRLGAHTRFMALADTLAGELERVDAVAYLQLLMAVASASAEMDQRDRVLELVDAVVMTVEELDQPNRTLFLVQAASVATGAADEQRMSELLDRVVSGTDPSDPTWEGAEELRDAVLAQAAKAAAESGLWDRAEGITGRLRDPYSRAELLTDIAERAARAEQWDRVEALARRLTGPIGQAALADLLSKVAQVAAHAGLWDRAEEFVNGIDVPEIRVRLLGETAQLAAERDQHHRARALLDAAEATAARASVADWKHIVLGEMARAAAKAGLWDQAQDLADRIDASEQQAGVLVEAAREAARAGNQMRVLALLGAAGSAARRRGVDRVLLPPAREVSQLTQLATRLRPGTEELRIRIMTTAAEVAGQVGADALVAELLDAAEERLSHLDEEGGQADADVLVEMARVTGQGRLWDRAERLADRIGDPHHRDRALTEVARAAARAEAWDRADAVLERMDDPQNQLRVTADVALDAAQAAVQAGEQGQASELLQTAEAIIGQLGEGYRGGMLVNVARVTAQMGDQPRTEFILDQAEDDAEALAFDQDWRSAVLAAVARAAALARLWPRAMGLAGQLNNRQERVRLLAEITKLASDMGEKAQAGAALEAAEDAADQLGPEERAQLLALLARTAGNAGEEERARAMAAAAFDQAEMLTNADLRGEILAEIIDVVAALNAPHVHRLLLRALSAGSSPKLLGAALVLGGPTLTAAIVGELSA